MYTLCDENFDDALNIIHPELSQGDLVVMWQRPGCPHCDIMKPEFEKADRLTTAGAKFAIVDIRQCPGAFAKANGPMSPYKVAGVPKVVSYSNGKYFSTYVNNPDAAPEIRAGYRKAADIALYADTIGTVEPVQNQYA